MSCRTPRATVPTVEHKVRPGETLSSIAAQFDTTPSELCSLNRLSMRTVFADQVIKVPDPEVRAAHLAALEAAKLQEEQQAATSLATSPRAGPGLAARVPASPSSLSTKSAGAAVGEEPESVHERQFVKSDRAKLITWGEGVVSGVLIVTPQSLMFDPGYSDPLVIERGHMYFQVHIDLVHVISVSVYKDPRAMKILAPNDEDADLPSQSEMLLELGVPDSDKSESVSESVFRPGTPPNTAPVDDVAQETTAERGEGEKPSPQSEPDKEVEEEREKKEGEENEREENKEEEEKKEAADASTTGDKETDTSATEDKEVDDSTPGDKEVDDSTPGDKEANDSTPGDKEVDDSTPGDKEADDSTPGDKEGTDCLLVDVPPDSAAGFLPRPSRHYDNAPVYMCIRHRPATARNRKTGRTPTTSVSRSVTSSGSSSSGLGAMAGVGKQEERLPDRGQHWFSIPQENARELYAFLRRSGVSDRPRDELGSASSASASALPLSAPACRPDSQCEGSLGASRSVFFGDDNPDSEPFFVVHEGHYGNSPQGQAPSETSGRSPTNVDLSCSTESRSERLWAIRQESLEWELISRAEMQAVCGISPGGTMRQETLEEELPLPTLIGKTLMLTEIRLRDLMKNLPTRAEGCINMRLSYSTAQHGFSLASLYRRCKRDIEDRPCVLLIMSQGAPEDTCFGAILSHSMHISDHYYGNGETKLIRWTPQLEISDWTGENNYILKGGCRTFMVGSSSGRVALWLDEDLYRGRSQVCETFEMREPLSHDGKEDFIIENLEVWTFN